MHDPQMFEVIQSITPCERGELKITSVNNWYVEQNAITCNIVEGEWTDTGTFESLNHANQMLFLSITPSRKVRMNNAGSV
jgi:glucose-1-phosphate thymidylyltransferase